MTEIYPAPDQSISSVVTALLDLGFADGRDFKLHYSWDTRPYIQTTEEAYAKWASSRGGTGVSDGNGRDDGAGEQIPEVVEDPEPDSEKTSESDGNDTPAASGSGQSGNSRKRTTQRGGK